MDVTNSSGGATQVRVNDGGHLPRPGPPKSPPWQSLAPGASLHFNVAVGAVASIEFRLPNGRTIVQAIDGRTAKVELVRERTGGFRTIVSLPKAKLPQPPKLPPPKPKSTPSNRAAGGRR